MFGRLFGRSLLMYLAAAISAAAQIVMLPHILAHIGAEQFGVVASVIMLAQFCTAIIEWGQGIEGPQRYSLRNHLENAYLHEYSSSVTQRVIVTAPLMAVALVVTSLWDNDSNEFVNLLLALLVANALGPTWLLIADGRDAENLAITIVSRCVFVLTVYCFVDDAGDSGMVVLAQVLSALTIAIGVMLSAKGWKSKWEKEIFEDAWNVILLGRRQTMSNLLTATYCLLPVPAVALISGAYEAGLYAVVDRIVKFSQAALSPLAVASYTTLVRLRQSEQIWTHRRFMYALTAATTIAVIIAAVMVYFSEWMVVLLGASLLAASALKVAALIPGIVLVNQLAAVQVILVLGQRTMYFRIVLASFLFSLALVYFFVSAKGAVGMAALIVATELLVAALAVPGALRSIRLSRVG